MKYILPMVLMLMASFVLHAGGSSATLPEAIRVQDCSNLPVGEKTVCHLTQDYQSTVSGCGSNGSGPAFLCSGVIFRGTDKDLSRPYHSWDPSPASVSSGGVSFSYLRADSKYNKLAYGYVTGFILYDVLWTPDGLDSNIEILCGFPIDAGTGHRNSKGCGSTPEFPQTSAPCDTIGISTASQWYQNNYNTNHWAICGFTLAEDSGLDTRQGFNAMVGAMGLMGQDSFEEQNELRLATWAQNKMDLPVQAFFYLSGHSDGLLSSQKDQRDYQTVTGHEVPIIEMKLPTTAQSDVQFIFNTQDQVIPL